MTNPNRLWLSIFGVWMILLSGLTSSFLGSPGIYQAVQLQQILNSKQNQIEKAENELMSLQEDSVLLDKSKITQQREIRRVLGYAASNELIFDFTRDSKEDSKDFGGRL